MRLKLACGHEELWIEFPQGTPAAVAQVLQAARDSRPDLYQQWCDGEGMLRSSLLVFVNGELVRYLNGLETQLHDGREVYVIPVIAGG